MGLGRSRSRGRAPQRAEESGPAGTQATATTPAGPVPDDAPPRQDVSALWSDGVGRAGTRSV